MSAAMPGVAFRLRLTAALLGVLVLAACGDSPTAPSPAEPRTFLSLVSSPGDGIGNGFTQRVGLDDAVFSVRTSTLATGKQSVSIGVEPKGGITSGKWWWTLTFTAPTGRPLAPGTFEGTRWPGDGTQAGFDFSGSGAGCGASTARFTITEIERGSGTTLNRLQLTFEQTCTRATAPIRGELSIVANPWR